jgi:hypothetical protein
MPKGFEEFLREQWKQEFGPDYDTSIFISIYESMVLRAVDEYLEFLQSESTEDGTKKEDDGQRHPDGDLQTDVSGE